MTWLNTTARVVSLTVVLPLVLRQFAPADIALYHLFASLIALQLMCGSGFVPTFARFFNYVLAGARIDDLGVLAADRKPVPASAQIDVRLFANLVGTLDRVFVVVSLASLPIGGIVGTLLLRTPISASENQSGAWAAWAVVVCVTPLTLYANRFSALLQGANQVALEQRWSAFFVILGALSGALVLLVGGRLFELVLANQIWQIASFGRLAWLNRRVLREIGFEKSHSIYSQELFRKVWPASWRSFVGVVMSNGVTAAAGLGFAQRVESSRLAEFLFGLRIMSIIAEISRAPFYSKLPQLNVERVRGNISELMRIANRGMRIAGLAFVILFTAAPLGAAVLLPLIGSRVAFPPNDFWVMLGTATLVERWGAMHLQLYSTTNHIIWHWLNGVTGVVWIAAMLLLAGFVSVYAYPAGMLLAYGSVYTQISVRKSLRSLGCGVWNFEQRVGAPIFLGFLASSLVILAITI